MGSNDYGRLSRSLERTLLETIALDWKANRGNPKAQVVLAFFRISHECFVRRRRVSPLWLARYIIRLVYKIVVEWLLTVELPDGTTVGPELRIHHGQALVVNGLAVIGRRCTLRHSTTIGCVMLPDGSPGPSPTIGDDVDVGANAVILGGIKVNNGVKIGAGAVVVHDVPENAVVVGNPAKVIKYRDMQSAKLCVTSDVHHAPR